MLNAIEGVSCDLFFADSKESLFLSRRLKDFNAIAVSIAYEDHIFSLVSILKREGIEPEREKRTDSPLLIGGGIGLFYNPAPFMPIFDVIYLGEAEGRLEDVITVIAEENLEKLESFDNVIISKNYQFVYEDELLKEIIGEKRKIFRSPNFSTSFSHSCLLTGESAFSNMFLIELNRGCIEKCRFCVASYMGLPYREKEIEVVNEEIKLASKYTGRVGLIGAGVTDYSKMEELYRILKKYRMEASFSSLKASSSSPYIFKIVEESGQKTATLAPETGSESLRFAINKKVKDETYFSFAEKLFQHGIENLKLYFLIGLPEETEEDIKAIPLMVQRFREIAMPFWKERGKTGEIHVSVNPVIAKPFTPLQWFGLNRKSLLEKKLKTLSKMINRIPNAKLSYGSLRSYIFQAIISRGDPRVGEAAIISTLEGSSFRKALKEKGLNFEQLYTRERHRDELFPWDLVDSGIKRDYLWQEYVSIKVKKESPTCFKGCRICGLC